MMGKKIRVYLQKPWKTSDSPYYKYLKGTPPIGVEFVNSKGFKLIQNKRRLGFNNWLKGFVRKIIRVIYPSMPNVHYTKSDEGYDLIHCAHCISKNKSPWVCDMEFVGQFWAAAHYDNFSSKKNILKYITSPYCRKIFAWSEWTKKGILKEFPEVADKIEVLYPAVPLRKVEKRSYPKINLLFIGRNFELKGGMIALDIFDRLTKKYDNVNATIVSDVPGGIIKKYGSNKKIEFHGLMSHEKLFGEVYPKADIFVYPTFSDTFGFAILEAQSFGLPVVAMRTKSTHTIKETIREGDTGFVVENLKADAYGKVASDDVVNEITERVERLAKDRVMLKKMSENCFREIKSGKFSIEKRNEKLEKIYRNIVKS